MLKDMPIANQPILMSSDKAYSRILETPEGPTTPAKQRKLQVEMGFNYCQII